MGPRKRRAPSPPPPPPPPPQEEEEESSEESGSEELGPPSPPARRMPPPAAAAAAADLSEGSDSDSDTDAQAFQLQVHRSPTKLPPHRVTQPESGADGADEEVEASESEPENPEPVVQKAAAAGKSKAEQERKRPAADPAPSGKAKKAKAGAEKAAAAAAAEATPPGKAKKGKAQQDKAAPEATPAGKVKKGKAEPEKAVPEASPAGKGKKGKAEPEKVAPEATPAGKGKKGGVKLEKPVALDTSPSSSKSEKPARNQRHWGKSDEMKILEALAAHVKSEGTLPKTDFIISTIGDRLDRKNCTYTDMYEKVRQLKGRYEKAVSTGVVPSKEDELQMYELSEAVWGEKAKEAIAAATSQNDGTVTKSKKGHTNKQKMDTNSMDGAPKEAATSTANQDGDSQKGSKKGQAIKLKTERDLKSRLSKEATTTDQLSKSKKRGNHNEEIDKDAKSSGSKDATTNGTQNGSDLGKGKREKTDKGKMDIDRDSLMPKEATAPNQNGGTSTKNKEGKTHDEEIERDANVQGMRRGFDELQSLYSNLATYVAEVEAQHPCGETLKRAFEFIGDEKAQSLESKLKKQRVDEAKAQIRRADVKKDVLNTLMSLVD